MEKTPAPEKIIRLRKTVYDYFRKHGRALPWRRNITPYRVFVSEVMLQQTQVDRVVVKFTPFIRTLPDFSSLARAPLRKVLLLWEGLGYNRRALHCKRAAETVMSDYAGVLPDSPELLEKLPGIGKATAASIAVFAFDRPSVFLETNIRSVLIHHFFTGRRTVRDEELLPLASAVLDRRKPRAWYSALMDYGAMLKKLHGNASRRSARYKKQGRFEGSNRQKRGKLLRVLLARGESTTARLEKQLRIPSRRLAAILKELISEKIIVRTGNRFRIP